METGEWGQRGTVDTTVGTVNTLGQSNEGAVAGILWDIFDNTNDDYSNYNNWGDTIRNNHQPDGIGDNLSDGIDNILSTLLDRNVNGHHPDHIDEFWTAWFKPTSFNHLQEMRDIWYEHGEQKGCCVGMRGNVNGDASDLVDIADLVYFIDYSFGNPNGPPPPCIEEADVDATSQLDIADIVLLVNYMFGSGLPSPADCP